MVQMAFAEEDESEADGIARRLANTLAKEAIENLRSGILRDIKVELFETSMEEVRETRRDGDDQERHAGHQPRPHNEGW